MKLRTVEVEDFKSIRRSKSFSITDITCLVGKNESGKTALLEAIYRLNPVIPEHNRFDITEDYPRSDVEDYRQDIESKRKQPTQVIKAVFELETADIADITSKFGPNVLTSKTLGLSRGYAEMLWFTLYVDEKAAIKHLVEEAQLPAEVAAKASEQGDFARLHAYLTAHSAASQNAFSEAMTQANTIADAQSKATAVDRARALAESEGSKQLRTFLVEVMKHGLGRYIFDEYLEERVPKFLYFDEYYQMKGAVNIQKLLERQQQKKPEKSDLPMMGLIDLARLKPQELIAPKSTTELISKLQGASNHLSKQVLKYWSQNKHIRLTFDVRPAVSGDPEGMREGTNLWGFVHDDVHQAMTGLGTRSKGFIWFFSFLAWYSQQKKENQSMILLLDEPGLFLHGSAQGDFLRYIEEQLKADHQVIYTTHSPFMVDPKHFERVRIVEDKSMISDEELPLEKRGTKVTEDVLEVDDGTLFPLQGALGYEMAQTLFIGPNSLIVEGVSDLLYISAISSLLEQKGRTALRSEWIVTPVGGAEKVPTFAALIGTQPSMNVATLIDLQKKDQQNVENLYKRRLLKKTHVLTYADFTNTSEADVEDMFEPDFYLKVVNKEYESTLGKPLTLANLPKGGPRIVSRIEQAFKASATEGFNHYRPARNLNEHLFKLSAELSDRTLDRFESIFVAVNKLL